MFEFRYFCAFVIAIKYDRKTNRLRLFDFRPPSIVGIAIPALARQASIISLASLVVRSNIIISLGNLNVISDVKPGLNSPRANAYWLPASLAVVRAIESDKWPQTGQLVVQKKVKSAVNTASSVCMCECVRLCVCVCVRVLRCKQNFFTFQSVFCTRSAAEAAFYNFFSDPHSAALPTNVAPPICECFFPAREF